MRIPKHCCDGEKRGKKTENKKRANIVRYILCAHRISGRWGVRGSCADVILIDPRFLPLIAHYPRCRGISHVLIEAIRIYVYTRIRLRNTSGITRYVKYIYI